MKRKVVRKGRGGHMYVTRRDWGGVTGEDQFASTHETSDVLEIDSGDLQRLVASDPDYAAAASQAEREFGGANFSDPEFVSQVLVSGARRSHRRPKVIGGGEYKPTSGWVLLFVLLLLLGSMWLCSTASLVVNGP